MSQTTASKSRAAKQSSSTTAHEKAFRNLYHHGFARVAACTLPVVLADPATNAQRIMEQVKLCAKEGVVLTLFPEMSLTGYSLDDLFMQDVLLDATRAALATITKQSAKLSPVIVVGAPLLIANRLYNCAVTIHHGEILGIAPKSYLPNYREFYEKRQFASGVDCAEGELVIPEVGSDPIPVGTGLIYQADNLPGLSIHTEICEDMWVPIPPSTQAALLGATVLLNLSASPITVARAADRHLHARSASSRCNAAYLYAAAMQGESSTDLSWDGQSMAYECGELLGQNERFAHEAQRLIVDIDLDRLRQERLRQGSFDDTRAGTAWVNSQIIPFTLTLPDGDLGLRRHLDRFPFVPDDEDQLAEDCYEAYNIQVSALEQRINSMTTKDYQPSVHIGVSGGLDSTHALLVAAATMDRLGRPRTDIHAYTMPGFATSEHTKNNAIALMKAVGVTWEELDIRPAARQMLADMGHPFPAAEKKAGAGGAIDPAVFDVTFENVQAGLRTDYLFRLSGSRGGFVLGTGDLSELALGWCTYGVGDQMSHYGVNAGVPKTLMQHLVRWVSTSGQFDEGVGTLLRSILDTEISPELVPAAAGEKPQSTQAKIGPYALQDFTLYYVLRRGYRPSKIAFLAEHAWGDAKVGTWPSSVPEADRIGFDRSTRVHWQEVFITRFFASQYKRTAMPNGPKVMPGGTLSPRGDWRAPSDVSAKLWLDELAREVPSA